MRTFGTRLQEARVKENEPVVHNTRWLEPESVRVRKLVLGFYLEAALMFHLLVTRFVLRNSPWLYQDYMACLEQDSVVQMGSS